MLFFRGRVYDRDTLQPVAGAKVRRFDGKEEVASDERGRFAFPILKSELGGCHRSGGTVGCSLEDPATTRFFVLAAGSSPLLVRTQRNHEWSFELPILVWRSGRLRGTWIDADGQPVAHRTLKLSARSPFPWQWHAQFACLEAATDAYGDFRFDAVPARIRWSIQPAESDDNDKLAVILAPEVELAAGEEREITLRSAGSRRIRGVVRDAKGGVLARAGVWMDSPAGFLTTSANDEGSFVFPSIAHGTYELKVLHPREYGEVRQGRVTTLEVGDGEGDLVVEVTAMPVEEIRGRLLDAKGQPIGGEVWSKPELMPLEGSVDVPAGGTFVLRVLAGDLRLLGSDRKRLRCSPIRTVPSGSKDVDLSLEPAGSVAGRVTNGATDSNASAMVELQELDARRPACDLGPWVRDDETRVLVGRTFRFPAVPCGRWTVQAHTEAAQVSARRVLTIVAGQEVGCPDLELAPAATLLLVGTPGLGDVEIEVQRGSESLAQVALQAETTELVRVPCGSLRVLARRTGEVVAEESIEASSGSIQLVGIGFRR